MITCLNEDKKKIPTIRSSDVENIPTIRSSDVLHIDRGLFVEEEFDNDSGIFFTSP